MSALDRLGDALGERETQESLNAPQRRALAWVENGCPPPAPAWGTLRALERRGLIVETASGPPWRRA